MLQIRKIYFTHLKCYRKLEENFLLPKMKVIKYWKSEKQEN